MADKIELNEAAWAAGKAHDWFLGFRYMEKEWFGFGFTVFIKHPSSLLLSWIISRQG